MTVWFTSFHWKNYPIINSEVINLSLIRKASFCSIKWFVSKFSRGLRTIGRHLNDELDAERSHFCAFLLEDLPEESEEEKRNAIHLTVDGKMTN
jgi:hypothetical protein